jgi:hypothetical protein
MITTTMKATYAYYDALALDGLLSIREVVYRVSSCTEREPSLVALSLSGHSTRHAASSGGSCVGQLLTVVVANEPWFSVVDRRWYGTYAQS